MAVMFDEVVGEVEPEAGTVEEKATPGTETAAGEELSPRRLARQIERARWYRERLKAD